MLLIDHRLYNTNDWFLYNLTIFIPGAVLLSCFLVDAPDKITIIINIFWFWLSFNHLNIVISFVVIMIVKTLIIVIVIVEPETHYGAMLTSNGPVIILVIITTIIIINLVLIITIILPIKVIKVIIIVEPWTQYGAMLTSTGPAPHGASSAMLPENSDSGLLRSTREHLQTLICSE